MSNSWALYGDRPLIGCLTMTRILFIEDGAEGVAHMHAASLNMWH